MAFSSGTYTHAAADFPAVATTLIESAKYNNILNAISTGLSTCLLKDGSQTVTADIPWGNNKITGLKDATALADATNLKVIQNQVGTYIATVGGTADVITLTASPAVGAYVAGQRFTYIQGSVNTTNVTVNINGLGAKALTKNGTDALVAGDIPANMMVTILYDGTRFMWGASVASRVVAAIATITDADNDTKVQVEESSDEDKIRFDTAGTERLIVEATAATVHPHGASTGNTYELRFEELAANGTHYAGFKSPDSIAANVVWQLPNADGSSGEFLKTDGSKALSWGEAAAGGKVLQIQTVTNTTASTHSSSTGNIPSDNTIPQSSEGVELMTLNITPSSTSSTILITAQVNFAQVTGNPRSGIITLFQDSVANALCTAASNTNTDSAWSTWQIYLSFHHSPSTTSQITYKIRVGQATNEYTWHINANTSGNARFAGTWHSFLHAIEIGA
jgi:hypothetical protein